MKYNQNDPKVNYLYRRTGCLFNNKSYYANMQEVDTAFKTSLMLEDQMKWKSMGDLTQFATVLSNTNVASLMMPDLSRCIEEEEELERDIKHLLKKYRDAIKYHTRFSDTLTSILGTALTCYELNKSTGNTIESDSFKAAIKASIPDGHVFKAFPLQTNHRNAVAFFELMKNDPTGESVVSAVGDQLAFAVRARVVAFPEGVRAVWLILGVHYVEV